MGLLFFRIKAKRSCPILGKIRPGTTVYNNEQRLLPHVQTLTTAVCPLYAKISINTLMGPLSLTNGKHRTAVLVLCLLYASCFLLSIKIRFERAATTRAKWILRRL